MPTAPAKPRVTLRDIARLADVSVACVSLALRNSPRITLAKRQRIKALCLELGYVRDGRLCELMAHLRSCDRRPRGSTLAAVVTHPYSDDADYAPVRHAVLEALQSEAQICGYGLDVFDLGRENLSPRRLRQILVSRGIAGIVVLPSDDHTALRSFNFADFSVIGMGDEMEGTTPHRVCANFLKMTDSLMRLALAAGHRRVGLVPDQSPALLRNRMIAASIDFHLESTPSACRILPFEGSFNSKQRLPAWLESHRPDLILGSRKTYEWLRSMGYDMPGDFGFACWDVTGWEQDVAGMNPQWERQGREAVRQVVAGINRNELGLPTSPVIFAVDSDSRAGCTLGNVSVGMALSAVG